MSQPLPAGLSLYSDSVRRRWKVYNETGDLGLAAQILGNASPDTANVYAKRHKAALTNYAKEKWQSEVPAQQSLPDWSQLVANPMEVLEEIRS